jgi:hypothetical protein
MCWGDTVVGRLRSRRGGGFARPAAARSRADHIGLVVDYVELIDTARSRRSRNCSKTASGRTIASMRPDRRATPTAPHGVALGRTTFPVPESVGPTLVVLEVSS